MRFASLLTRFGTLAVLAQVATAHIELQHPPGIRSKFDPQTQGGDIDYSMTSPLEANGANFPCKGYNTPSAYSSLKSVDTLVAGSDYTVTLAGSATHNGGSCQFAISYDEGATFVVIASIIGSCPIGLSFTIPIPANLPSASKATFSWTWFNFSGNREMYQNCAIVDVSGSNAKSYTGPSLFRANTFADDTCITTEGQNIVFPNPGPSVQYLGGMSSSSAHTVLSNCPFNEDSDVTVTVGGSSSPDAPPAKHDQQPSSSAVTAPVKSSSSVVKPAPSSSKPPKHAAAQASITAIAEPVASALAPASSASSVSSHASSSSSVAVPASDTSSTTLRCDSATSFSLCGGGTCTAMGAVAAGTICVDGEIISAVSRMTKTKRNVSQVKLARRTAVGHFGSVGRRSVH